MNIARFSIGIGDRFARQGQAQLSAFVKARSMGVDISPVWNKSNREHLIVHSEPASVRSEADSAVKALGWTGPYHVDADHIGLKTVDRFIALSDFFTIDVADFIDKPSTPADVQRFVDRHCPTAPLQIAGIDHALTIDRAGLERIAGKYLFAVQEAGRIYRHIESTKGRENFITEVSMDETDAPQTPIDLLFILCAIADERIPIQTIAPKFTGRFNKGVDYVGDLKQFEQEFNDDLCVIAHAVKHYALPGNLKLSVHSGSDKFSIYPIIRRAVRRHQAGLHLKTAGTTWLEELIGLASAGDDGLTIAREVYLNALNRFDELCGPYATVIDIDRTKLPTPEVVRAWNGERFAQAIRHDPRQPNFNPHLRQLLHVGYKVAAKMGERYLSALAKHQVIVAANVTTNLFDRHIRAIFLDD